MFIEGRIDDLIEAGWNVLDSDFDPVAFLRWRRSAFDYLTAMVGPDHVYTRRFESFLRHRRGNGPSCRLRHTERGQEQMGGNEQAGAGQNQWRPEVGISLHQGTPGPIGRREFS